MYVCMHEAIAMLTHKLRHDCYNM